MTGKKCRPVRPKGVPQVLRSMVRAELERCLRDAERHGPSCFEYAEFTESVAGVLCLKRAPPEVLFTSKESIMVVFVPGVTTLCKHNGEADQICISAARRKRSGSAPVAAGLESGRGIRFSLSSNTCYDDARGGDLLVRFANQEKGTVPPAGPRYDLHCYMVKGRPGCLILRVERDTRVRLLLLERGKEVDEPRESPPLPDTIANWRLDVAGPRSSVRPAAEAFAPASAPRARPRPATAPGATAGLDQPAPKPRKRRRRPGVPVPHRRASATDGPAAPPCALSAEASPGAPPRWESAPLPSAASALPVPGIGTAAYVRAPRHVLRFRVLTAEPPGPSAEAPLSLPQGAANGPRAVPRADGSPRPGSDPLAGVVITFGASAAKPAVRRRPAAAQEEATPAHVVPLLFGGGAPFNQAGGSPESGHLPYVRTPPSPRLPEFPESARLHLDAFLAPEAPAQAAAAREGAAVSGGAPTACGSPLALDVDQRTLVDPELPSFEGAPEPSPNVFGAPLLLGSWAQQRAHFHQPCHY